MIIIGLAGFIAVLLATRWGIGTSSDSARYIRSARHVLGREPRTPAIIEAPAEQAHFPPLYSTVLALASLGGADPLDAARWVNALLLVGNGLLAAALVRRYTRSRGAALLAAGAVVLSPSSLSIHAWALSEPLYILLSLAATTLLLSNATAPRMAKPIAAALLTGLAMLTRYAGVAMIPTGLLIVLLLGGKQRWRDAAVFGACAVLLPAAWSLRNAIVLGSAANRVIAFHPITLSHLADVAEVCWNWFGADGSAPPVLMFLAAIVVLAGLVAPMVLWRSGGNGRKLALVMLLYIGCFSATLALSISLIDFHTPVDARVLAPVYIAWIVLACCGLAALSSRPITRTSISAAALVALLCGWATVRSALLADSLFNYGGGFAQASWRASAVIAATRQLPADTVVYTNAPGAVYLLTGRTVIMTIPSERSASSDLPNPEFEPAMQRMGDDLRARRAVLVYLGRYNKARSSQPTDVALRKRFGLHPVLRQRGDGIYDYLPAPATTPTTAPAPADQ